MKRIPVESMAGHTWLEQAFSWISLGLEYVGVAIILVGAITSTSVFVYWLIKEKSLDRYYQEYRSSFGKAILLGLEFFVASDIVNTVAVGLTFKDLGMLGLLVVIRTFLSFALEVEINGQWPWKGGEGAGKGNPG
ncbi:MAG: DUF1622 domain-containing protein [Syntrophales bacterium]|nr:DUF1622 domain-containing protein [Syntrophales bacterium]MDD5640259.1 DUF1622 domain-containing protein [Syntrophales bacterium]